MTFSASSLMDLAQSEKSVIFCLSLVLRLAIWLYSLRLRICQSRGTPLLMYFLSVLKLSSFLRSMSLIFRALLLTILLQLFMRAVVLVPPPGAVAATARRYMSAGTDM